MHRAKSKIGLLLIAAASIVYWLPQGSENTGPLLAACALWSVLSLAALRLDKAEDWNYRFSAFIAVALATMEGFGGVLSPSNRDGLLVMAGLHLAAFVLALTGRYQKVKARRPGRGL